MKWLREHGIDAQIVEKIVPHGYTKIDLFGSIDIVALPGHQILGIQTTTGEHHAERETKAATNVRLAKWIANGGGFEVWSWAKRGKRGKRKLWTRRVSQGHLVVSEDETVIKIEFREVAEQ
jgi:hypothetical protein